MDEAARLAALPGAAEIVEAVALGEPLDAGLRNPDIGGTKRTILVRTEDGLDGPAVAAFEQAMIDTPRYITAIRNWRVTRVTSSRGGWTLDRKSVVNGKGVSVVVAPVGGRFNKYKNFHIDKSTIASTK